MKGFDVFPESFVHRHIFMLERVGGKLGADVGFGFGFEEGGRVSVDVESCATVAIVAVPVFVLV